MRPTVQFIKYDEWVWQKQKENENQNEGVKESLPSQFGAPYVINYKLALPITSRLAPIFNIVNSTNSNPFKIQASKISHFLIQLSLVNLPPQLL